MTYKFHSQRKSFSIGMPLFKVGVTLFLLNMASVAHANLLTNGSFELGGFVDTGASDETMLLSSGSTAITGWTVIDNNIGWIGPNNPWVVSANDGDYFLDLTDYPIGLSGGISQDITTVVGDTYELSFDLGSSTMLSAGNNSVVVSVDTNAMLFYGFPTEENQWDMFSLQFLANTTTTNISFTSVGAVHAGSYIGLDNVGVVNVGIASVPESSTIVLLGSGLIGLVGFNYKRNKRGS